MKDNRTLEQKYREMKLQEVSDLYYGSDKARDTYAKDTPGQTPGVDHNPDFQRHGDKGMELAVDGVPEKGGMINKPQVSKAIKKDASPVKFKSVIAEIADTINENMTPEQRKAAAKKIFQMRMDQKAKQDLQKPKTKAAVQARRDAASYKTSDDSHLDKKEPAQKRGRGEKDLPHIVSQLRGVVDTGKGVPSKVKFKDGTTKSVKPKHAASWLKKHDSAKPAEKLAMYKSHDNKKTFKQYAKEDFVVEKHMSEKGPNCGCGKDPCETYGNDPLMPKGENAKNMNEMKSCPEGEYYCMKDQKCKPIPEGMTTDKDGMLVKEAVRAYDRSSKGRAYRRLSDEEKQRLAKKNELMRAARRMRRQAADDYESQGRMRKPTIGGAKSVYRGKKTTREQMEQIITGLELRFLQEEEKMVGSEYQGRMKKHGKMSDAQKKAVTSVYDKKPVDKKMAGDPQVKRAQRYMKVEQAVREAMKGMGDSAMTGMDPNDATPKAELENERSKRLRKMMQKPRVPGDNVKHQMRPKGMSAGEAGKRKLAKVAQGDQNRKLGEASAAEVLKKRYASTHPDDNPQATRRLKPGEHNQPKGARVYQRHPGTKFQSSTGSYSKKGKMAALKKQHARRPEQYGITRESEEVKELYPSHNTGTIDMDANATPAQKKARADHAKKRDDFEKKYPGASTSEKMFAKLSKDRKNPKKSFKSPYKEEVVNELSRRTLTNYIQKAANPTGKKSAINYASKGAYKLGSDDSGNLSAGEKDDRKAFKRGKGIMRAAQKIQRKTYGNMTKPTPYGGSEMSKSLTRKTKKEEVVNELKKSTLGSYIKKATGDAISKSHTSQFNLQKGMSARDKGQKKIAKKYFDKGQKASDKVMKRFHGINRAAGKLTPGKGKDEYLADKNPTKMGKSQKTFKQMHSSKVKATEAVDQKDVKGLKKLAKGLKGSSQAHLDQMKKLNKMISDSYIAEKSLPNNPKLWAAKKAQAKAKFDVYPSAYANGWAAKQYKKAGGTWRSAK